MTTFAFPAITPNSSSIEMVTNTKTYRSPLTNSVQTSNRKGSLWKASLNFSNLSGDDRAIMQAFLTKLNGQEHRFTLHDHSYVRRGIGIGTLTINGADQGGVNLVCLTTATATTGYVKAGDYISFNNELHMVTADANSNGTGNITIAIAPPIRKPTINAGTVNYTSPVNGVFMLASSANWSNDVSRLSSFTIDAIEDVLA